MNEVTAIYATGKVIEYGRSMRGMKLPFPDGRPIKLIIPGDMPPSLVASARNQVHPIIGEVVFRSKS